MEAEIALDQLLDAVNRFCGQLCIEAKNAEVFAGDPLWFSQLTGGYDANEAKRAKVLWDIRERLMELVETHAPSDWEARPSLAEMERRKAEIVDRLTEINLEASRLKEPLVAEWKCIARKGEMVPVASR